MPRGKAGDDDGDGVALNPQYTAAAESYQLDDAVPLLLDTFAMLKSKVQDLVESGDANEILQELIEKAKLQQARLDQSVRAKPYVYVFGAMFAGFALSRVFRGSSLS